MISLILFQIKIQHDILEKQAKEEAQTNKLIKQTKSLCLNNRRNKGRAGMRNYRRETCVDTS
jgi:hypothetical protein